MSVIVRCMVLFLFRSSMSATNRPGSAHPPQTTTHQPLLQPHPQHGLPAQHPPRATGSAGKTAQRAGGYGGSEVGSLVGNAVGPPIIGGIIGNLVGDKVGQKAIGKTGLDRAAGQFHEDLSKVVGEDRANKVGDMVGTALGFAESERCLCCPCMPASQILFFIMIPFYVFNWYRLIVGIRFDASCIENGDTQSVTFPLYDEDGNLTQVNETEINDYWLVSRDTEQNLTTYLVSYPCEFGFHYLVAGAGVWIFFLPFHILTLFGNCWRQCCCCFCDPVVCFASILDCCKRCLCECGKFSILDIIWYSMCLFHVIWACLGARWLIHTLTGPDQDHELYDYNYELIPTVISAVVLDLLLAGSEIVHKIRILFCLEKEDIAPTPLEMVEIRQNYPNDSGPIPMQPRPQQGVYPSLSEMQSANTHSAMHPR
ncbi:uncharacterized protein LOC131888962 [Tigriopus californicus]|uniref:uncharacterized protein LOC131888962 n=1 Tax=Tigriopus californicus TaxID=6832 RepID=UPI0027DA2BC1|nr:uncharacterized protein LOC131888962 [Tigriopus californicus]